MPYRCHKCANTFKTIHLYNRHAASAADCGVDQIVIARPQERREEPRVEPRVDVKRPKVEEDDEPVIISTNVKNPPRPVAAPQQQRFVPSGMYRNSPSIMARTVKFSCTKCAGKFDSRQELEQHEGAEHEEAQCAECEDDFSWPAADHQCYYTRYQLRSIRGDIVPAF